MRALIQRVTSASVTVNQSITGAIGRGFLVLLGVEAGDDDTDCVWMVEKITKLRVFDDPDGHMNLSLSEVGGDVLVVSQFTLFGTVRKGNRPSFNRAAPPAEAERLYLDFLAALSSTTGKPVPAGIFGAMMAVSLVNDGPVTLMLDSKRRDF
ncbi:MAG: D-tyrosyl-tRNA(Tyr) deacylase [Puniceicoccales bacterium]|jgi:D-tyrosyl-tRNA(Tyr) deacylase|nr:D-tyrosyl-tRNA(Tyr) deacylase [Puniceicoccales bacterium]